MSYPPDPAAIAALRTQLTQIALLGHARRILDQVAACSPDRLPETRTAAADIAQRIVDEIGHPTTDEPALGPWYRTALTDIADLATTGRPDALQRITAICATILH